MNIVPRQDSISPYYIGSHVLSKDSGELISSFSTAGVIPTRMVLENVVTVYDRLATWQLGNSQSQLVERATYLRL